MPQNYECKYCLDSRRIFISPGSISQQCPYCEKQEVDNTTIRGNDLEGLRLQSRGADSSD